MSLHESGEMYLETIYVLSKNSSTVRSLDVAEEMNFSKPSVSRAIKILKDGGFVTVDENGYLSLTEDGKNIAKKKKQDAFSKEYDLFAKPLTRALNEKLWDKTVVDEKSKITTDSFFDVYSKYFIKN